MIRWIVLAVLGLDQLSKILVLRTMSFNQSVSIIPSAVHITLVANPGIAFGLFKGNSGIFILAGVGALFWIAQYVRKGKLRDRLALVGLGLILGGAIGNLIDRLLYGHVIDFIDFRIWPVFNVADACISVGTALFFIACLKK